jgi:hypothetical protein
VALASFLLWRVAGILGDAADAVSQTVENVLLQVESSRAGGSATQPAGALMIVSDHPPSQTATGMGMAILISMPSPRLLMATRTAGRTRALSRQSPGWHA